MFLRLLTKDRFCLFSVYIFNMFKILRARLHYKVMVTPYRDGWYLFWNQLKKETHDFIYIGSKVYRTCNIENFHRATNLSPPSEDGRGCNKHSPTLRRTGGVQRPPPLRRTCYRKCLRGTRVISLGIACRILFIYLFINNSFINSFID